MVIDRLNDVMNYFYFAFIPIYALFTLVVIFSFMGFVKKEILKYSLVVSGASCFSIMSMGYFLGVLGDNQADLGIWTSQLLILLSISCILFIVQAIKLISIHIKSKK